MFLTFLIYHIICASEVQYPAITINTPKVDTTNTIKKTFNSITELQNYLKSIIKDSAKLNSFIKSIKTFKSISKSYNTFSGSIFKQYNDKFKTPMKLYLSNSTISSLSKLKLNDEQRKFYQNKIELFRKELNVSVVEPTVKKCSKKSCKGSFKKLTRNSLFNEPERLSNRRQQKLQKLYRQQNALRTLIDSNYNYLDNRTRLSSYSKISARWFYYTTGFEIRNKRDRAIGQLRFWSQKYLNRTCTIWSEFWVHNLLNYL